MSLFVVLASASTNWQIASTCIRVGSGGKSSSIIVQSEDTSTTTHRGRVDRQDTTSGEICTGCSERCPVHRVVDAFAHQDEAFAPGSNERHSRLLTNQAHTNCTPVHNVEDFANFAVVVGFIETASNEKLDTHPSQKLFHTPDPFPFPGHTA
jgi:hypothetical protein